MKTTPLLVLVAMVGVVMGSELKDWTAIDKLIDFHIAQRTFPGAVAAVATFDSVLYSSAKGSFTYGVFPPASPNLVPKVTLETIWDLASCSKVLACTSAAALLYQKGLLDLDATVDSFLPGFGQSGKQLITVRMLLEHNSGLPGDPTPGYFTAEFGCPDRLQETWTCNSKWYAALLAQKLTHEPGTVYEYSDIGFIAMGLIIGRVARDAKLVTAEDCVSECPTEGPGSEMCFYEAFLRLHVLNEIGVNSAAGYLPPRALWARIAPTENDTTYRGTTLQGQVHDQNTYAMGGISGHAGLFSTLTGVIAIARRWLFAGKYTDDKFINASTMSLWTKEQNKSVSSRALGWNTNSDTEPDAGWGHVCGSLSPTTFLHIGYTGTLVCADPERSIIAVLLTNRVYPDAYATAAQIKQCRKDFGTLVQKIFDS